MAEKLTGIGEAGNILSELNRDNYFTDKHYDLRPCMPIPPTFQIA
jgi:hypothetical protein